MDFTLPPVVIFTAGMKILFVCATPAEAVLPGVNPDDSIGTVHKLTHTSHQMDVLITGAGMVATTYHLGRRLLMEQYDLAVNVGICGTFSESLMGKTVNVKQDCFGDFGAEDHEEFLDVFQLGLMNADDFPFKNGWMYTDAKMEIESLNKLPQVKGVTVNTGSGNNENINKLKAKYNADIESMEGAAFIYCCKMNNVPCLQIRSVSNYIEKRNRNSWQIEPALNNLLVTLKSLFTTI